MQKQVGVVLLTYFCLFNSCNRRNADCPAGLLARPYSQQGFCVGCAGHCAVVQGVQSLLAASQALGSSRAGEQGAPHVLHQKD